MQGYAYHNVKSQKMDENYKMMRELNDKIAEHQANKLFDLTAEGALALDTPIDPTKPLSLDDRQKAINKKQSMELELAKAKSDITEQRDKDLIDYKEYASDPNNVAKANKALKSNNRDGLVTAFSDLQTGDLSDNSQTTINNIGQKYQKEIHKLIGAIPSEYNSKNDNIESITPNTENPSTILDVKFKGGGTHQMKTEDFVKLVRDKELEQIGLIVTGKAKDGSPTVGATGVTEIATPIDFTHRATIGQDTIYSKNGKDWFYKDGKKAE